MCWVFAITLGDVELIDVDATGLTRCGPPLATLGGLLLLRIVISFWRTSVCCCFIVTISGMLSCMNLTILVAALTVIFALEMYGVVQGARKKFPTAWIKR